LYATSSATGSVEVYDLDGNFVTSLNGTGVENLQRPIGITQTAHGHSLVTDAGLNAVLTLGTVAPPVEQPGSPVASPVASPITTDATPSSDVEPTATAVG